MRLDAVPPTHCPLCHQRLRPITPPREQVQLGRLVNRLRAAEGGLVTHDELADALWGDDPDGGPNNDRACLRVLVHKLRRLGYPIENEVGRGYRFKPRVWELSTSSIGN